MGSREDDEYWNEKYGHAHECEWCGLELNDLDECEECDDGEA